MTVIRTHGQPHTPRQLVARSRRLLVPQDEMMSQMCPAGPLPGSVTAGRVGTLRATAPASRPRRGVSSMAEQRTFNPSVQGSSPWRPTSHSPTSNLCYLGGGLTSVLR